MITHSVGGDSGLFHSILSRLWQEMEMSYFPIVFQAKEQQW